MQPEFVAGQVNGINGMSGMSGTNGINGINCINGIIRLSGQGIISRQKRNSPGFSLACALGCKQINV